MSTKRFTTLNYTKHFLILASVVIACILISISASLLAIPIGVTEFPLISAEPQISAAL